MAGLTAAAVAARFDAGRVAAVQPVPGGHINDSWRVETDRGTFLLQRLNARVFADPARLMDNVIRVTRHLGPAHAPRLVATRAGGFWLDDAGSCWRMYESVAGCHSLQRTDDPEVVREAARAYGEFARLLTDIPGPPLHRTIEGFHDTPRYLAALEDAARTDPRRRAGQAAAELAAVRRHAALAHVLPPLLAGAEVPTRIAHHDAKLANVLFDDATRAARCVVDLDTVMPGSLLFDFGDLVRSLSSGAAEDESDPARVRVRLPLFEALVAGYLEQTGPLLTSAERGLLVHAGLLITFEQAVRFLTDYLIGDTYYKVSDEGQNLRRTRTQLTLLDSLRVSRPDLERIVARQG